MRRRCYWCCVELRWWQLNACRVCRWYMVWDYPSPPCSQGSRIQSEPDRMPRRRRGRPVHASPDSSREAEE